MLPWLLISNRVAYTPEEFSVETSMERYYWWMDTLTEFSFDRIEEYIFAPFNIFVYIDEDKLIFGEDVDIRQKLVDKLNHETDSLEYRGLSVEWCLEDCEDFKLSKGVFSPPGTENSFVMAKIVNQNAIDTPVIITEEISDKFPAQSLTYSQVRFYFQDCGVGTCSVRVDIEHNEETTILQLEQVSEQVNNLFKQYFEELCFDLTKRYRDAVENLDIPRHDFTMLPAIEDIDRAKHFIPWTHRIYHIQDDSMFEMENPGEPFKVLLTPSRKMDICDLSIYDNRWIYFGWGHSIIFTASYEDGYSQTSRPVYDYVRLVEIAQANWQFLDILKDIVTFTIASFNRHYESMKIAELQTAIDEIRSFRNGMDRILSNYRGVKITFDTEKRVLLRELHERWLTNNMLENLLADLHRIEELLDQLHQRQKETREESLNTIALLFTIVGIIEIIALVIDVLNPVFVLHPFTQLLVIAAGTVLMAAIILLFLRISERS
ncbi:MAG: hypothetical protein RTU92_07255 [Candidatus Thorarchaeota archaeon]